MRQGSHVQFLTVHHGFDVTYEQQIKNYKNVVEQDVDKILDTSLEVHKDAAYILLLDNQSFKNTFPSNKSISDVTVFVNTVIIEKINKKEIESFISDLELTKIIEETKTRYNEGFSKEYREKNIQDMKDEIVSYMKEFNMIKYHEDKKEYEILPIIFKIRGEYPKEFNLRKDEIKDGE